MTALRLPIPGELSDWSDAAAKSGEGLGMPRAWPRDAEQVVGGAMRMVRVGWRMIALAMLVVLIAGCTGAPLSPSPTTASSASSTGATPTNSSIASTPGTPATTSDEEMAIQAISAFVVAFNGALRTRNTVEYRRTFTSACSVCKEDAQRIDDALAAGHTFEGEGFSVSGMRIIGRQDEAHLMVRGTVTLPPLTTRDASGRVIQQSSGSTGVKDISVVRVGDRWLVELVSR